MAQFILILEQINSFDHDFRHGLDTKEHANPHLALFKSCHVKIMNKGRMKAPVCFESHSQFKMVSRNSELPTSLPLLSNLVSIMFSYGIACHFIQVFYMNKEI